MIPEDFVGEIQTLLIRAFAITECRLHPVETLERLDDWHRAGLPASSMPEGRRGGESPIPVNKNGDRGKVDVDVEAKQAAYLSGIGTVVKTLRDLITLETGVIPEYHMTKAKYAELHARWSVIATELESVSAVQCANPHCHMDFTKKAGDGNRAGRCKKCYEYRYNNGRERSFELCQRDIEREQERKAAEKRARSGKRPRAVSVPLNPTEKVEK